MSENVFINLISTRHSVRSFKDIPIPQDKLQLIVDAATRAPSSGNLQSYQICIVSKRLNKEKLTNAAYGQEYITEAPLVMIFCADPRRCGEEYGKRGEELFCIQDASISCSYAQLAAHSLGISSVWIGSFDENQVSDILRLEGIRPIAILPIGYSNENPDITGRRPLDEIVQKVL